MTRSTLHLRTPHASRYLQQLGKHFGHKVPVSLTATEGAITLPFGTCEMTADDMSLSIAVLGDDQDLERLEQVMGDHLARFAFRENPTLIWQRAA